MMDCLVARAITLPTHPFDFQSTKHHSSRNHSSKEKLSDEPGSSERHLPVPAIPEEGELAMAGGSGEGVVDSVTLETVQINASQASTLRRSVRVPRASRAGGPSHTTCCELGTARSPWKGRLWGVWVSLGATVKRRRSGERAEGSVQPSRPHLPAETVWAPCAAGQEGNLLVPTFPE